MAAPAADADGSCASLKAAGPALLPETPSCLLAMLSEFLTGLLAGPPCPSSNVS